MEVLKRHCSLPDFQRMCCKSCRGATDSPRGSTPVRSRVSSPPSSTTIGLRVTSVHTAVPPQTVSHSPSTPPPPSPTAIITTAASVSTPVLSIAFSTPGTPVMTTSHPLHLPAPDTHVSTDLRSNTVRPTTSGVIVTALVPTGTTPSPIDQAPVKSKPKKNISPKKTKYIKPPKINTKKNNALKNTTRNYLPKTSPKKKINDLPRNHNQEEIVTEKPQAKATPKKSTPANAAPKKPAPKKPATKKAPPKTKPKKDIQPKTKPKKPVPAKTNLPKKPKSESKTFPNTPAGSNQTKATETRMNPRDKSFETTTLHFLAFSLKPEATTEHFSTTIPSSTGVPLTVDSSEDPTTHARTPLWYLRAAATTPSSFGDATPTQREDANLSSGAIPYGDVPISNSGDIPVTSGAVLSGDDMTMSFSNVGMISDTMVLDDGLTVVIPTINSEDLTDAASSPWLDQSEFILVDNPVPTVAPTMAKGTVAPPTQRRPPRRPDESNDNNLIDIYNKNTGADGDISQNNLIPKHRVNLRERTKNKRIQELLEEKRNFLLRMKRGHAA